MHAGEVSDAYPQRRGGVMSAQREDDAMTKAWTYAVLDALEAADENTRLEMVRILCPAGFEVVQVEVAEARTRYMS